MAGLNLHMAGKHLHIAGPNLHIAGPNLHAEAKQTNLDLKVPATFSSMHINAHLYTSQYKRLQL